MRRTYYGITTENASLNGWRIVAIGATRNKVDAELDEYERRGRFSDTECRNLRVVTKTRATSTYGICPEFAEHDYWREWDLRAADHANA